MQGGNRKTEECNNSFVDTTNSKNTVQAPKFLIEEYSMRYSRHVRISEICKNGMKIL